MYQSFGEAMGARTFRNLLGYAIFFLSVIVPSEMTWQYSSATIEIPSRPSQRDFFPDRSFGPHSLQPRARSFRDRLQTDTMKSSKLWLYLLSAPMVAIFGTTLAMMILAPYWGCKRYAILFGPPTGILTMTAVSFWLLGRTEIYRWEPPLIACIAMLPTGALWFLCCKRAYEKRLNSYAPYDDEIVEARLVE